MTMRLSRTWGNRKKWLAFKHVEVPRHNHAKHKSVVTEISTIAHNLIHKHSSDQGATTGGCIKNNTNGKCINLIAQYAWSGHNKQPYPQYIPNSQAGTFVHVDKCNDEAAVVYADECGAGWLLAWCVSDLLGSTNKVYVETGPIENYMFNINWSVIKAKLDASSDTSHCLYECNEAFAKITDGPKAALVASYTALLK